MPKQSTNSPSRRPHMDAKALAPMVQKFTSDLVGLGHPRSTIGAFRMRLVISPTGFAAPGSRHATSVQERSSSLRSTNAYAPVGAGFIVSRRTM
jgi:hypothetical protein